MSKLSQYKGCIIRVRHAFKMDHCGEEIVAWKKETNEPDFFVQGQGSEYLKVDATENVLKLWDSWQHKRNEEREKLANEHNAKYPDKGMTIRAIKGKNKGQTGVIYAKYENRYSKTNEKLYFKDEKGNKYSTYNGNIEILFSNQWVTPVWYKRDNGYEYICSGTY